MIELLRVLIRRRTPLAIEKGASLDDLPMEIIEHILTLSQRMFGINYALPMRIALRLLSRKYREAIALRLGHFYSSQFPIGDAQTMSITRPWEAKLHLSHPWLVKYVKGKTHTAVGIWDLVFGVETIYIDMVSSKHNVFTCPSCGSSSYISYRICCTSGETLRLVSRCTLCTPNSNFWCNKCEEWHSSVRGLLREGATLLVGLLNRFLQQSNLQPVP